MSYLLGTFFEVFAEHAYGNTVSQNLIHGSETFDAVMMESYFGQEHVSAFIHKFGCVGIEIATMGDQAWLNELSGNIYIN